MINKKIPSGFNSIDKIYVVEYDNGEMYDDAFHCVDKVFNTYESAQNYLESILGLVKQEPIYKNANPTWSEADYVCSMNNINCDDCPKCDGYDYGCDEYEARLDSEWDNSYYTIEEYDLLDIM